MSFDATILRVLIASPSDLAEERDATTQAINEWNALHAAAESVVLLPVRWETHATPRAGVRPQQTINEQLVRTADMVVGLFWTKLGTNTGVAESGTVEEIDQFVETGKPALLYFSSRPIDPAKIDIKQHKKLKAFRDETYKTALVGGFASPDELRQALAANLLRQVRQMNVKRPASRPGKLDEAAKITELIVAHKRNKITPEEFAQYRDQFAGRRQSKALTADPVPPGEVGPNGHQVGYTKEGDKVEWIPDEENVGEVWPMVLRRNDKAILAAEREFADVIWYDRKLVLQENLKEGIEKIDPEIEKGMLAAMRRVEKKYGKRKLRSYYSDDFEWGMLNGKLSALRWVLGDEWDVLHT
ncbi:DUF4062 domain-containing protein [Methylocystis iwaonis]|uniref:DUF4062 domain-containing protein n=1 Tax=Methylocystis iwaonis TaxID=2885079 RepID=A0ABN6VNT4_9HYPH|nr:DUF4062 domain-containing protein [Methylocystis iwaonis]BDV36536.1 hypothetical protein SS37A_40660 [Methylocystis iwaonis]